MKASSGPAVTWRTVNELLRQSPLCQVGCATLPARLHSSSQSLDDDRPGLNWTSRQPSLVLSSLDRPGRLGARSLHSPVSLDRPGRLDFEARWLLRPLSLESLTLLRQTPSPESLTPWLCFHPSSLRLLLGVTSSCHITGVPPHTSRQDHRRNRPQPTLQELSQEPRSL